MMCEDYPCCGHGPAPHGDGGGCPDAQGRFKCVLCAGTMPARATSSICTRCQSDGTMMHEPGSPEWHDAMEEKYCGGLAPDGEPY